MKRDCFVGLRPPRNGKWHCERATRAKQSRGFTLIEAVVALAVFALAAVTLLGTLGATLTHQKKAWAKNAVLEWADAKMNEAASLPGDTPMEGVENVEGLRVRWNLTRYARIKGLKEIDLTVYWEQWGWPEKMRLMTWRREKPAVGP